MKELYDFLEQHAERGDCQCGKCADAPGMLLGPDRESKQPSGHTANLIFFHVAAKNDPDADKLKALIQANKSGDFANVDLFDGKEHNYQELGGWIGDQGAALELMGLGALLGLWKLLTPITLLGLPENDKLTQGMATMGYVSIKADGAK